MIKRISAFLLILFISFHSFSESRSELFDVIGDSFDKLYVDAETTGGKNYNSIIKENVERFSCLLDKQADVNIQGKDGETPLMMAAYSHQWEIMDLLIKAGADASIKDKHGKSALNYLTFPVPGFKALLQGNNCIAYIRYFIMQNYYTKERQNKCVDLLTKNIFIRVFYKRYLQNNIATYF